jgi:hypothetical protein
MTINFKKSACLRVGQRCEVDCGNIVSYSGQSISWVNSIRYLGIHIMRSRVFKCKLDQAKRSFYRAANSIFGKVGRRASEEVVLELIRSKCLPTLLYGLEACPLNSSENKSLDFVFHRFLMKLFKTSNMNIIEQCIDYFGISCPTAVLASRKARFIKNFHSIDNIFLSVLCK